LLAAENADAIHRYRSELAEANRRKVCD
jgi:hypothetical protein